MKPSTLGALIGALAGFVAVLMLNLLTFFSPLVIALLFPGRIFLKYSNGMNPFGHMIFDTLAYFTNIVLYAAVGFGLGKLLFPRDQAPPEENHDGQA